MAWVKYFVIEENWCNGFPDALVGADEKEKEIWDFLKKHEIDYGYKCDQTIPSFVHNGISWYCHQKSAKKVQTKFNITDIVTDKEQLKEEKNQDSELRKLMKTEEWLLNKLQKDANDIIGRGNKKLKFSQLLKDANPDIAKVRLPKAIQKLFDSNAFAVDEKSVVIKGENFKIVE